MKLESDLDLPSKHTKNKQPVERGEHFTVDDSELEPPEDLSAELDRRAAADNRKLKEMGAA